MAKKVLLDRQIKILGELLEIPSPSGFSQKAIEYVQKIAEKAGISTALTRKGALLVGNVDNPRVAITGHIDTLGLMVKEIRPDGNLNFAVIGSPILASFEGELVKIFTDSGKEFSGSLILNNPACHVNRKAHTEERNDKSMHIRIDAEVKNAKDTKALGINVGDFVAFEAGFQFTETEFIKGHFLDDKAGCAAMIDSFLTLGAAKLQKIPVVYYFSNFEEVGHGASSGIPTTVEELLVVDMGVVGDGVAGDEYSVSICAKDSMTPYNFELRQKLVKLAKKKKIPYQLDIFPFYGSDGTAALSAGMDLRIGLIGPGVSASHGNERTHLKAMTATRDLLVEYLKSL
jgi:putative aminopeptidase FrvX